MEEDKKSLAIVNLQAMTGSDDIDKIIRMLEENDWDESKAANAFFNAGPPQQPAAEDMDGYRAPIQQQED